MDQLALAAWTRALAFVRIISSYRALRDASGNCGVGAAIFRARVSWGVVRHKVQGTRFAVHGKTRRVQSDALFARQTHTT